MSTLTVTLTGICSGGNHLTFTSSGVMAASVNAVLDDLNDPITPEEMVTFVKVIAQMAKVGRTIPQARTILQTGVTVTV